MSSKQNKKNKKVSNKECVLCERQYRKLMNLSYVDVKRDRGGE